MTFPHPQSGNCLTLCIKLAVAWDFSLPHLFFSPGPTSSRAGDKWCPQQGPEVSWETTQREPSQAEVSEHNGAKAREGFTFCQACASFFKQWRSQNQNSWIACTLLVIIIAGFQKKRNFIWRSMEQELKEYPKGI